MTTVKGTLNVIQAVTFDSTLSVGGGTLIGASAVHAATHDDDLHWDPDLDPNVTISGRIVMNLPKGTKTDEQGRIEMTKDGVRVDANVNRFHVDCPASFADFIIQNENNNFQPGHDLFQDPAGNIFFYQSPTGGKGYSFDPELWNPYGALTHSVSGIDEAGYSGNGVPRSSTSLGSYQVAPNDGTKYTNKLGPIGGKEICRAWLESGLVTGGTIAKHSTAGQWHIINVTDWNGNEYLNFNNEEGKVGWYKQAVDDATQFFLMSTSYSSGDFTGTQEDSKNNGYWQASLIDISETAYDIGEDGLGISGITGGHKYTEKTAKPLNSIYDGLVGGAEGTRGTDMSFSGPGYWVPNIKQLMAHNAVKIWISDSGEFFSAIPFVLKNSQYVKGVSTAFGFQTESDRRNKKNIETLEMDALAVLKDVRSVQYNLIPEQGGDTAFGSVKKMGVIAQELDTVLPNLVDKTNPEHLSVDYTQLTAYIPLLYKKILELEEKITKLES